MLLHWEHWDKYPAMVKKRFSESLSPFEGEIKNVFLRESISLLKQFLGKRKLQTLVWDENHIAVSLKVAVNLPPLGTFDGIDIRNEEDVLFVFSLSDYPNTAPWVHTDRLDFPKNHLAHLYIAKEGKPPAFCYVRGNYNEWYANKRISDLVIRIKNWLRDAAAGELTENGDQFDPLRLEGYRGTVIYSYDKLVKLILENKSLYTGSNFALALFENTAKEEDFPSFRLEKIITANDLQESVQKYIVSIKELIEKKTFKVKKYHLGYILWSDADTLHSDYCIELPRNWIDFKKFCSDFSINTAPLEEFMASFINFFSEIPIITALKRPKQLIGFSSFTEFVNFYIELKDEDKGEKILVNNVPVHFQAHNEPLTTSKAELISGGKIDFNGAAIVGCGALGSKVAMHFLRNGAKNLLFIDNDKLSPHNLVRHALTPQYEGVNKAVALMSVAANMFRNEDVDDSILGFSSTGNSLLNGLLVTFKKELHWIFDFTASESFFQTLTQPQEAMDHIRICRGNISDHGNLGVLLFEGKDRNPRIDDLQILLFSHYNKLDLIKDWLKREANQTNQNVHLTVGVGCNSETIILADDVVSSHSSYFSMVIKREVQKAVSDNGVIYLHQIEECDLSISTHRLSVPPLVVTKAVNDPSWEIRIKACILEVMKSEMGLAMPHETGGVFIGTVNYKMKTIHVVDLIKAPQDSKANSACFFRGVYGLPEKVKDVNTNSGNQLGYIGEWHSHPFGPNSMSTIDAATVRKFKAEFSDLQAPLPVFLTIITPTTLLCYVY